MGMINDRLAYWQAETEEITLTSLWAIFQINALKYSFTRSDCLLHLP